MRCHFWLTAYVYFILPASLVFNTIGMMFKYGIDPTIKDKDGNTKDVTRDEFIQAGYDKAMKPNEMEIDTDNRKIIAKFEKFNNK